MVLAELTAQVAASRPEGQNTGSREEMVQRLLLNGVDTEARAASVRRQHHLAAAVFTNETKTSIAWLEIAGSWAQVANHASIFGVMPPTT